MSQSGIPMALPGMPPVLYPGAPEKSKTPMYIAGGVVGLLVVGVGLYFALRKPTAAAPSTKKSSSASATSPATTTATSPAATPPSPEPEVFSVRRGDRYSTTKTDAAKVCEDYGAKLATKAELQAAYDMGADWCNTGWIADDTKAWYPNQFPRSGCGGGTQRSLVDWTPSGDKADVTCYGIKPNRSAVKSGDFVLRFNEPAGIYFQPPRER